MTISSIRSPSVVSSSEAAAIVSGDDSLRKIVRQRATCSSTRRRSSAHWAAICGWAARSWTTSATVASGVPNSWAAAAAMPSSWLKMLLAGEGQLGGGQRAGELPRLLGDPAAVDGDERRR